MAISQTECIWLLPNPPFKTRPFFLYGSHVIHNKLTITYYNYKQLHKLQLATGGKLLLGEKGIVIIIRALKGPVPQDHLTLLLVGSSP